MRIAYKMELEKREISAPSVNLVRYDSSYKDEYKRIYNECYHEMREALDIKPYDYIQDDSFFEEGMENVYLLINAPGEIIGGVARDMLPPLSISCLKWGLLTQCL